MDNISKKALGIIDERLNFEFKEPDANSTDERTSKGLDTTWHCTLTYDVNCPKCGKKMNRNGFKQPLHQKLPNGSSLTFFQIKKQKFICLNCGHTELAMLKDVSKNDHFFRNVKHALATYIEDNMSITTIAKLNSVSTNTVMRTVSKLSAYLHTSYHYLPRNIAFDNFKSGKF